MIRSLSIFLVFLSYSIFAQEYDVEIDLEKLRNDKVPVEIICTDFELGDDVIFQMPKIVPGTYSISDFGRVVSELHAYDVNAEELEIEKLDVNRWKVKNANRLHRLSYWVEDTFDDIKYRDIFEPGGSTF